MAETEPTPDMTIRSHRCRDPLGEFDYNASEERP